MTISLFVRRLSSPPYCGVPSLSHHFPWAVEVVVDLVVDGCPVVVVVVVVVLVTAGVVELVVVVVVVEVVQEAKTSDVRMRQVNAVQMAPLFICPPF